MELPLLDLKLGKCGSCGKTEEEIKTVGGMPVIICSNCWKSKISWKTVAEYLALVAESQKKKPSSKKTKADYKSYGLSCSDNVKWLESIKGKPFKMSFADPKYNVGFKYHDKNITDNLPEEEYIKEIKKWFGLLYEKTDGVILITPGKNNAELWTKHLPKPKETIIWYKKNSNSPNAAGGINVWEPILYYVTTNVIKKKVKIDLIVENKGHESELNGFHGCPKSLMLLRKLITEFSDEGDIISDIFSGSGTTMIAAYLENRIFRGCDMSEYYCIESADRANKILNDKEMFRSVQTETAPVVAKSTKIRKQEKEAIILDNQGKMNL